MKKNYERNQLIISVCFIFMGLCLLFLINTFTYRYRSYKVLDAILISDNYVKLIITNSDLKLLKSSKTIIIDNHKLNMKIIHIEKNVLKRKYYYHEVIIKIKVPQKYHDGDYIKVTIYNQKLRLINMFKSCWKE